MMSLLMHQPSNTLIKRGQKCQEVLSQSDAKWCSTSNLASHKNNDLFMNRIRGRSENSFAHGKEHEIGASGYPKPLTGKEHLPSSCDSVTTQPLLTRKEDLKPFSVIVNGVTNSGGMGAEPSKFTRTLKGKENKGHNVSMDRSRSKLLMGMRKLYPNYALNNLRKVALKECQYSVIFNMLTCDSVIFNMLTCAVCFTASWHGILKVQFYSRSNMGGDLRFAIAGKQARWIPRSELGTVFLNTDNVRAKAIVAKGLPLLRKLGVLELRRGQRLAQ
ncbi:hypothetical protein Acr_21g0004010 [Actinidia rufa]|uniref:Uncharacterized protein n=1 Tax=Actinidia rufa TaxID=165716 RepID=A0A7J0GGE4_9ERIC|nr:hypothetical protein Acr_21g0004010 [Actinidia rufa]